MNVFTFSLWNLTNRQMLIVGVFLMYFMLWETSGQLIEDRIYRVAYILSGSARSFVMPSVRKSIRKNLIESFCRPPSCIYDIFVRVSSNDNKHVGIEAVGKLSAATAEQREKIAESMTTLEPRPLSGGHLFVEYYEIGSENERKDMIAYANGSFTHKIYREFDPRRYSMYYGRWAAYKMMIDHEKANKIRYDWVVHARLDTAFGEPIPPHNEWFTDRIYAPDTWHSDIPDTFALLPRNASDVYYDLDMLLHEKIICLGGPNLDPNTFSTSALLQRGYRQYEITLIQNEDCRTRFPLYNIVHVSNENISWSFAGFSEFFLMRKLKFYGYSLGARNVELRSFSMFIVRYPLKPVCFYLNPNYLISWVKVYQAPNAALEKGCISMMRDVKRYTDDTSSICQPLPSTPTTSNIETASLDSCLLREETTDMNFMPFRIRSKQRCLTVESNYHLLNMSSCINYRRERFMTMYATEQLFLVYPLIRQPQQITHLIGESDFKCLTVKATNSTVNRDENRVFLSKCWTEDAPMYFTQLFQIRRVNATSVDDLFINTNSKAHWKPTVGITISWQHPNLKYAMCLSMTEHSPAGELSMRPCRQRLTSTYDVMISRPQFFVLERTRSGVPYRSGITIGSMPTWKDKN